MKSLITVVVIVLTSCLQKQQSEVKLPTPKPPSTYIETNNESVEIKNDTVFVDGNKYSGFLFSLYPNSADTEI